VLAMVAGGYRGGCVKVWFVVQEAVEEKAATNDEDHEDKEA
jgi:hypothetical protein